MLLVLAVRWSDSFIHLYRHILFHYMLLNINWNCQSWLFATAWTVALHAPLSLGFSRQGYWSGLPCPPPGHLPDPGIEPGSPCEAGRFFYRLSQQRRTRVDIRQLSSAVVRCKPFCAASVFIVYAASCLDDRHQPYRWRWAGVLPSDNSLLCLGRC